MSTTTAPAPLYLTINSEIGVAARIFTDTQDPARFTVSIWDTDADALVGNYCGVPTWEAAKAYADKAGDLSPAQKLAAILEDAPEFDDSLGINMRTLAGAYNELRANIQKLKEELEA